MDTIIFGEGRFPTAHWFKSAAFLLSVDGSGLDFTVPTAQLARWIAEFDRWYRQICGIDQGRRLHLMYHREISTIGKGLLALAPQLEILGQTAKLCGFGFSLTTDVEEVVRYDEALCGLIESGAVTSVGLTIPPQKIDTSDLVRAVVERIFESGVAVGLIGSVANLASLGLLDSPSINRSDLTIYPDQSREGSMYLPIPSHPVASCFNRFRVYVNEDGRLYPCVGLLGIPSAEMGTINEPIANTVLGGRPYHLALSDLASRGPLLVQAAPPERRSNLPWICERHRLDLINDPS